MILLIITVTKHFMPHTQLDFACMDQRQSEFTRKWINLHQQKTCIPTNTDHFWKCLRLKSPFKIRHCFQYATFLQFNQTTYCQLKMYSQQMQPAYMQHAGTPKSLQRPPQCTTLQPIAQKRETRSSPSAQGSQQVPAVRLEPSPVAGNISAPWKATQ